MEWPGGGGLKSLSLKTLGALILVASALAQLALVTSRHNIFRCPGSLVYIVRFLGFSFC